MKKLFYIFISILLLNCSNSDDSSSPTKTSLNPPTWIHGTWSMGSDGAESGYTFTSNDWCIFAVGLSTCWKFAIESSNGQFKVEETIGETSYTTKLTVGGITQTYTFLKVSSTKIRAIAPTGALIYTKK